jgi:hypothetical protein
MIIEKLFGNESCAEIKSLSEQITKTDNDIEVVPYWN